MNARALRLCTWGGIAFCVLFSIGWWPMAGFMPPPSPMDSPQMVADMYSRNTGLIRAGLLVAMFGVAFQFPFFTAIYFQMKRIEGTVAPMAVIQILTGTVGVFIFFVPMMLMEAASFRPDRDPAVTQGLNDAAWIPFLGTFMLAVIQLAAIAYAVFHDTSSRPVYPRWIGYFNIWVALGFPLASLNVFFKTGPFAWPGLFTFWIPATVYFAWFIVMAVYTFKAIDAEQSEEADREPSRVTVAEGA